MTPDEARKLIALRRRRDPAQSMQPTPTQEAFLHSIIPNQLVEGGNRSGKTAISLVKLSLLLRGLHPTMKWQGPVNAIVLTISRRQAATVIQHKLLVDSEIPGFQAPLIPHHEINFDDSGYVKAGNKVYYELVLRNGSRIHFFWSEMEDAYKRMQGIKADIVVFDENAGDRKLILEAMGRVLDARSRVSQENRQWGGLIWWSATGTEANEAFDDYRKRCEDPNYSDYALYRIARDENPAISSAAVEQFADFMTEEEKEIRIYGTKTASSLVQIFEKQWKDSRHIVPYKPTAKDNLWIGYDPGMDHPTGIIIAAINAENPITLRVVKEFLHNRLTLDEDAAAVAQWLCGRRVAGIVYDTVMKNTMKTGTSTLTLAIEAFRKAGILPVAGFMQAYKNHPQTISLVRHYLDPDPYDDTKPPLLTLDPSCTQTRWQIIKYRGREATRFQGPGGVIKKDDDLMDPLRYLVAKRPAYNPDWCCGPMTSIPQEDGPPILVSQTQEAAPSTPYERHIMLSKGRRRNPRRQPFFLKG